MRLTGFHTTKKNAAYYHLMLGEQGNIIFPNSATANKPYHLRYGSDLWTRISEQNENIVRIDAEQYSNFGSGAYNRQLCENRNSILRLYGIENPDVIPADMPLFIVRNPQFQATVRYVKRGRGGEIFLINDYDPISIKIQEKNTIGLFMKHVFLNDIVTDERNGFVEITDEFYFSSGYNLIYI